MWPDVDFSKPLPTRSGPRRTTMEFDVPSDVIGAYVGNGWTTDHETTVRLAQEYLSRFTYKPGWHFEVTRKPELSAVHLVIGFMTLDSRLSEYARECPACREVMGVKTSVGGSFAIPQLCALKNPEKAFWNFLRSTIWFIERHEADEWFRVDGAMPYDPHIGDPR